MEPLDETARAVAASVDVARRHGLDASEADVLRDATNVVVRLPNAGAVARVSMTLGPRRGIRSVEDEVAFAAHAHERGAPVVPPSDALPPGPHEQDGFVVTFWQLVAGDTARDPDPRECGRTLRALHDAVADFERELPACHRLDEVEALLRQLRPESVGTDDDLAALGRALAVARARLPPADAPRQPVHGDAHFGNVIETTDGPLWSDFENVCAGPREYDLACLAWRERVHGVDALDALDAYGPYDAALVEALVPAVGVFLAAWTIVVLRRRPSLAAAKYAEERLRYVHELARG